MTEPLNIWKVLAVVKFNAKYERQVDVISQIEAAQNIRGLNFCEPSSIWISFFIWIGQIVAILEEFSDELSFSNRYRAVEYHMNLKASKQSISPKNIPTA